MPTTGPSHTSLFTGLYPAESGVVINGISHKKGLTTITEVLRDKGYKTRAVVSGLPLAQEFTGIDEGFQIFGDFFNIFYYLKDNLIIRILSVFFDIFPFERDAKSVTDATIKIVNLSKDRPIFLFAHYFDPHHPYEPPYIGKISPGDKDLYRKGEELSRDWKSVDLDDNNEELEEKIRTLYGGEVAYLDRELGRLLGYFKETGIYENSIIVIFSDHGEGLGDHNKKFHGDGLYDEQSRVVMLFHLPERLRKNFDLPEPHIVDDGIAEMVDVAPTLADLVGVEFSGAGTSLIPLMSKNPYAEHHLAFFQDCRGAFGLPQTINVYPKMFALRRDEYKFIWNTETGDMELYNMDDDPDENNNLIETEYEIAGELAIELQTIIEKSDEKIKMSISQSEYEDLKSLGYID